MSLTYHTTRKMLSLLPFQRGKLRLAYLLYKHLQTSNTPVLTQVQSMNFSLDLNDRIQALFYLTGFYESETISTCLDILPKDSPSTYLDVGANVGMIALQLKAKRPLLLGHLFEADPRVFQFLKKNIELNDSSSFTLNHRAVSDHSGELLFFQSSPENTESGWGRIHDSSRSTTPQNPATHLHEVLSISVDDYLDQNHLTQIDLLKVDVEGAEEKVFHGAKKALQSKKIKAIYCEVIEENLKPFGSSSSQIQNLLKSFGYQKTKELGQNHLYV